MVKPLSFQCGGLALIPAWGTKNPIRHLVQSKKKKKQNKDVFNHSPLQKPINPLLDVEGRFKATFPQLLTEILVDFML